MKAKRVAPGIYRYQDGTFYERPRIGGKRTWRKLWSRTVAQAKVELSTRRSDHHRAALGLAEDPYRANPTILQLLEAYAKAGFPSDRGHPRAERTRLDESKRLDRLKAAFGSLKVRELAQSRVRAFGASRPSRAADLDLYTLRNAIRHGISIGQLDRDPVDAWPRFRSGLAVRHCRDSAPASGDELHRLAAYIFRSPIMAPVGWWLLLLALTGCRRSEVLDLRMDAGPREPGFVEGQWIWLRRRKGGINPFALITPPLKDCIEAHHAWHRKAFPDHPYWIPHRHDKQSPAPADSLGKALGRACKALGLPHRHPHALRAFYVTVRRSQGIADAQIAAEIGDATGASIIASTYGAVPPNWQGGPELGFLPLTAPLAWGPDSPIFRPLDASF